MFHVINNFYPQNNSIPFVLRWYGFYCRPRKNKNEQWSSGYEYFSSFVSQFLFFFTSHSQSPLLWWTITFILWRKAAATATKMSMQTYTQVIEENEQKRGITWCNENLSQWTKNKHKTQKTHIKIYDTKFCLQFCWLLVFFSAQETFCTTRFFFFFCGNKVKDGAKMLSERQNWENYLFQPMKQREEKFRTLANNFNENGIVLWAHRILLHFNFYCLLSRTTNCEIYRRAMD